MKITRDNYEEYFIDYLDGNLSDAQIHEFEAFLLQNPELRDEIEGLEKIIIPPSDEEFLFKENLKQIDISDQVSESNFEHFCIAEAEGDLSNQQIEDLNDYLSKHPEKQKERELILKLKVRPDETIVYEDKKSLKKSVFFIQRPAVYKTIAFAASIALLMIVYFSFMEKDMEQTFVSENTEVLDAKDSTSLAPPKKAPEEKQKDEKGDKKQIIPAAKQQVKKAAKTISFKVGIPIASVVEDNQIEEKPEVNPEEVLKKIDIDPSSFQSFSSQNLLVSEKIDPSKISLPPVRKSADPDEFQTIDEFVLTKFSELVFKEKEEKISGWGLASAGVQKINDLTGAKMQLEASAEEEGKPKRLSFNSRLLSFSTPINRED
jgi:hypothetical protein